MAYGIFFKELLDDLDNNRLEINERKEILFKRISLLKFYNDYDKLNEPYKSQLLVHKATIEKYKNEVYKYLSNVTLIEAINDLSSDKLESISLDNKEEYFSLLCLVNNVNVISKPQFINDLVNNHVMPLHILLENQKFVNLNRQEIKKILLSNPHYLELYVSEFDIENPRKIKRFFPPLTDDEIDSWIKSYIKYEYCNTNYLRALSAHVNSSVTYSIKPKTMLLIKEADKKLAEKIYKNGFSFTHDLFLTIDSEQYEPKAVSYENGCEKHSFPGKWISENLTNPTILNNLIYIFELNDKRMSINNTYNENNDDSISKALTIKNVGEYGSNSFRYEQSRNDAKFLNYYNYLVHKHNIKLEDVAEWFAKDYLSNEFGIKEFCLSLKNDGTYLIKCRNLFVQIELLLKQYAVFVENGEFSQELFKVINKSYKFSQYPSLIKDKYCKIANNDFKYILFLLFNDQSSLCYINEKNRDDNFALLITRHKLQLSDFNDYQHEKIKFLIKNKIVIDTGNRLLLCNETIGILLFEFYRKGFIPKYNTDQKERDELDDLINKGYVCCYSSLFSEEEADLLSYYLNNEKFSNSFHLRNGYEHGEFDSLSEEEHKNNYFIGLRLLFSIIIKINDDLGEHQLITSAIKNLGLLLSEIISF